MQSTHTPGVVVVLPSTHGRARKTQAEDEKPRTDQTSRLPYQSGFLRGHGFLVAVGLIFLVGAFLRLPPSLFSGDSAPLGSIAFLHPSPKWHEMKLVGADEALYRDYVNEITGKGLTHYPDIVLNYIERQIKLYGSILPPVRFLYIFTGYVWHRLFHTEALDALKNVASLFSILTLAISSALAWRMRGGSFCLALTSLVAFAPTQIHMSQHALVDGFFAFWALLTLWILWENLQAPRKWGWLAGYAAALTLLVLTKENSVFVWIAIIALLVANRWLQIGTVTRELVIATALGPLLGVVVLIFLAGGIDVLFGTYRLLIVKNFQLPYAIKTGDGPCYRYLVDLLLVSPIILILAVGAIFRLDLKKKPEWFALIFIAGSYLVMCNLKYGMNLRYANMWDTPLRVLAVSALATLVAPLARSRNIVFGGAIALICAVEFRQYIILFVQYPLYELVTEGLLRALHILK